MPDATETPIPEGQRYWFEPPDTFFSRTRGKATGEGVQELYDALQDRIDEVGPVYWIVDVRKLGHIDQKARRIGGAKGKPYRGGDVLALVIVGASFHQRILITLAIKANRLLRRDQSPLPVSFFATDAEARAHVAELRERRAAS